MNTNRSSKLIAVGLLTAAFLFVQFTVQAATTLTWDANTNGAPSDGSGNWLGGNTWWDGTNDVVWVNGSAVVIGTNTPGDYSIVLDNPVTATTVTFKTNNYTLSGANLTESGITLSSGVSAVINCGLTTAGGGITVGNNGSTLTLGGGFVSTTGNPIFKGTSAAVSTLNITNGTYSEGGTFLCDGLTINQSGGAVAFASWTIGRTVAAPAVWNLTGGTLRNTTGMGISRGRTASLNVSGTGMLGVVGNLGIASTTPDTLTLPVDATLSVSGGTANIGTGLGGTPGVTSATLGTINLLAGTWTYAAAAKAALNISGGVTTAKGILFGNAAGTYVNHPASQVNLSGGVLYLDASGIAVATGASGFATPAINLSGGTLAATANWIGSLPISLNTTNGDLTVQAADVNGTPWNITLSGGLSGDGGLIKKGGGILTLSGTNTYSGTTTVSNGQFTVNTAGATSLGFVSLRSGTTLSTALAASGQSWANTNLVLDSGVTADFNFGGFQLSPSASVIRVNGDLTLDSSDSFTIEGSTLITGTFPLITCTGTLTLTGGTSLPTITSLPSGVVASLARNGKTINLVVSSSPNIFLKWGPLANGPWDFTTADWLSSSDGSATNYTDGTAVTFDDNGTSAVAITLNATVQPGNVTVNNTAAGTASYTVTGSGAIAGSASVLLQGTGLLALGTPNTYSGGTTVNSGTLGINYGGDGSGPSGIGTGPLTLNAGTMIDNTSGSNVVLRTPLPEYWNGSFAYAGSQTNLDLGIGTVYLGNSVVEVTVLSNMLTYGGSIYELGLGYQLAVQGPGTLTLSGNNTHSGGTVLNSGKLNINNGGDGATGSALGTGRFTINGGTIDNTSGADVQLQIPIPESWNADFTFAGTTNLDLGSGTLTVAALTLTLQNGATLSTEGAVTATGSGAVATTILAGNGTFKTSGTRNNVGTTWVVNGGLFQMDKTSSSSVHSAQGGLTVNANGTARVTGTGGQQMVNSSLGPVTLGGGTLDLFGSSESMYLMNFNSGTLQNSSTNPATLTMTTSIALKGPACNVDVATNSALTLPSLISGTGSLIKIGPGTLNLGGTNTYTGSTTVSNGLLTFTTATTANRNYTVAGGQLLAVLDPTGAKLQMTMSNLTFGAGTRLGFDLASGVFGDTTSAVISAGALTMNGNVAVDITNAPPDTGNDVLLTYTSRQGPGLFVAGNVPPGAYINDNTASGIVSLTYTQPPPPAPALAGIGSVRSGGVLTGITFAGVHGPAGGSYHILSSTNVALQPLSAWTPVQSGNFDSSGSFNATISVDPAAPQTFYLLRVP